jgi:RND family efflux transporter MFP subunit
MKLALFSAFALLLAGCGGHGDVREAAPAQTPVAVKTIAVATAEWPVEYEAAGTVRARTSTAISAKVMGYVREVRVSAGDAVAAGQTLVLIDSRDLDTAVRKVDAMRLEIESALPEAENGIAAAKAQLELAQITFQRMESLFRKKSVSNQEFDEASARLRAAQAAHEMALSKRKQLLARVEQVEQERQAARIMRGYAEVKAPFAGTVTERQAEPGTLAAPGAPLLTLERTGGYRLEAQVEESRAGSVRNGQTVEVEIEALQRVVTGRVAEIVPAVDAQSRAYTVKIELPGTPQLRSGMFGRARFAAGSREVMAIPEAAVTRRGQLHSVLVAEGGIARNRLVTTGRSRGSHVEVLSGLSAGDRVIHPAPPDLVDGMKVEGGS